MLQLYSAQSLCMCPSISGIDDLLCHQTIRLEISIFIIPLWCTAFFFVICLFVHFTFLYLPIHSRMYLSLDMKNEELSSPKCISRFKIQVIANLVVKSNNMGKVRGLDQREPVRSVSAVSLWSQQIPPQLVLNLSLGWETRVLQKKRLINAFFFSFGVKLRLIQFSFFFQLNYLKNAYRRPRPMSQAVQLNLK